LWDTTVHPTKRRIMKYHSDSLVPRPLPDFISQPPWLRYKIWEGPGDEATILNGDVVGTKVSVRHRQGGRSSEVVVKSRVPL